MKENLKELGLRIVTLILIVLITSLIFFVLASIVLNIFRISINFTYLTSIGIMTFVFLVKFIVNILTDGIEIDEILKESELNSTADKKYNFTITYKNNGKTTGNLTAHSLKDAERILLNNNINYIDHNKKICYYNADEIQFCEIEEVEE